MSMNRLLLTSALLGVVALALSGCGEDEGVPGVAPTELNAATVTAILSDIPTPTGEPPSPNPAETATATVAAATSTLEPGGSPDASPVAGGYQAVERWDVTLERLGGITIGPDGRLFITDAGADRVLIFGPDGMQHTFIDYSGQELTEGHDDVAVSDDGTIFVLDADHRRVLVYGSDGGFLREWGGPLGDQAGQFVDPQAIAVDGERTYVAENLFQSSARMQIFTREGEPMAEWTRSRELLFPYDPRDIEVAEDGIWLLAHGYREGAALLHYSAEGELLSDPLVFGDNAPDIFPWSFAIGPEGNLFVVDPRENVVVVLDSTGEELARWQLDEQNRIPAVIEIAVSDAGRVYVMNGQHYFLQVFEPR